MYLYIHVHIHIYLHYISCVYNVKFSPLQYIICSSQSEYCPLFSANELTWHRSNTDAALGQWFLVFHTVSSLSQWAHSLAIQSCMFFIICVVYFPMSPFLPFICILVSNFYPVWLIKVVQVTEDVKMQNFMAAQGVFKKTLGNRIPRPIKV